MKLPRHHTRTLRIYSTSHDIYDSVSTWYALTFTMDLHLLKIGNTYVTAAKQCGTFEHIIYTFEISIERVQEMQTFMILLHIYIFECLRRINFIIQKMDVWYLSFVAEEKEIGEEPNVEPLNVAFHLKLEFKLELNIPTLWVQYRDGNTPILLFYIWSKLSFKRIKIGESSSILRDAHYHKRMYN